jgi:hypothetical protein
MQAKRLLPLALFAATAAAATPGWAYTYEIKQIGLTGPINASAAYNGTDPSPGSNGNTYLENAQIYFAGPNGGVVGTSTEYAAYNGYIGGGSSAAWYFNGTNTVQIGLTSSIYQNQARNNIFNASVANTAYGNSRIMAGNYITGTSQRFDATGATSTSLGADAWIYNATTNATTAISLPTYIAPTAATVTGGTVGYSYVATTGGTFESMGGGAGSDSMQTSASGTAAGVISGYFNPTTGTQGVSAGTDAFYFNGTSSVTIGLIDGSNLKTVGTGVAPYTRNSAIVRINSTGEVLGYSSHYLSNGTQAGNDMWFYNPANATGTGASGTLAIAPAADAGNVYTGGTSFGTTPTYLTDSGLIASQFVKFAATDTSRVTPLSTDAFIYNTNTNAYTQVGLTGSNYTQYASGSTQVGGSSFNNSQVQQIQAPGLNEAGQAIGSTIRTISSAKTVGTDVWIYNPSGPLTGTTLLGLNTATLGATAGAVYEQTVSNVGSGGVAGTYRSSLLTALEANGAVSGTSVRYLTTTNTGTAASTAGQDAWAYDPAHGITTPTVISLTGANYEFGIGIPGQANYRFAGITAENASGMVGGYNYRDPYGSSNANTEGATPWVFDPTTKTTYIVDPAADGASNKTTFIQAYISYISDSGVVIGLESSQSSLSTIPSTKTDRMFEWYLSAGVPTFAYLDTLVDPATFSNWSNLYNAPNFAPSIAPNGDIVGVGLKSIDSTGTGSGNGQTTPAFVLVTPEPASLGILALGAVALVRRRRA